MRALENNVIILRKGNYAYNPSHLGSGGKGISSKPALARSVRPCFKNKQGMVVHTCNPNYLGAKVGNCS
jgi:hypothetical protein